MRKTGMSDIITSSAVLFAVLFVVIRLNRGIGWG
jgi:hypothetical protein